MDTAAARLTLGFALVAGLACQPPCDPPRVAVGNSRGSETELRWCDGICVDVLGRVFVNGEFENPITMLPAAEAIAGFTLLHEPEFIACGGGGVVWRAPSPGSDWSHEQLPSELDFSVAARAAGGGFCLSQGAAAWFGVDERVEYMDTPYASRPVELVNADTDQAGRLVLLENGELHLGDRTTLESLGRVAPAAGALANVNVSERDGSELLLANTNGELWTVSQGLPELEATRVEAPHAVQLAVLGTYYWVLDTNGCAWAGPSWNELDPVGCNEIRGRPMRAGTNWCGELAPERCEVLVVFDSFKDLDTFVYEPMCPADP